MRYNSRPVLIASSVMTGSGAQLVSASKDGRSQNSDSRSQAVGTSGSNTAGTITNLSELTGSSAANHVGQRVRLERVTVDRVTGKRGFWANAGGNARVFIGLDREIDPPGLQQGEQVMVAGKVMKAPDDASTIAADKFGLAQSDVTQLMQGKVFIRADALRSATSR